MAGERHVKASMILVVPAYNEASRLDRAAFMAFLAAVPDAGVIFVNDGSADQTGSVLDDLAAGSDRINVVTLAQNRGKAEAVRAGMLAALALNPEFAGYWDADLATPLSAATSLREELQRWPAVTLVMGSRVRLLGRAIARHTGRHYLGRVFATAVSLVLGVAVYDTQCGAKLFRVSPETPEYFREPFGSRWIFDVELLARVLDRAAPASGDDVVHEFPLTEWHDKSGSRLSPMDFARAPLELLRIYLGRRRNLGQNIPTRSR